ncbi:N-ethylmaleimide reductase [Aureibacillus halotolerans]|uniref:N-ethylmaleimide reductase n=1 Tax=Aureibacillus halotolerans TaxID=1508390 RepID=A0A4R6U7Y5_9BACI|nr:alkene reductase [Aureibacillus halotolerans]TDQ40705.1 N-ethylmaleimide reductase [Aureibacillus halotolerans]
MHMQKIPEKLLKPSRIGAWDLRSRVVMSPMTRSFADNETGVVGQDVVNYYQKRAADGVGLIITEGIIISPRAKGTTGVPGLYTREQINAWRNVTNAVHEVGGTIVAQLWHVGRLSHHELTGGYPSQAPSAIRVDGLVHRLRKPYDMPEEMTIEDIEDVIAQFATAAKNAMEAGFDGVEIHGAHGYLIDQFTYKLANHRTDQYGGDLRQRLTFMKKVLKAVISKVGADRKIIRFSELKDENPSYKWEHPEDAVQTYIDVFHETGVKIIHPSTNDFTQEITNGKTFHQLVRKYWDGVVIGVGNLNPSTVEPALTDGTIDLAAFGRPLLANPDFVHRVSEGWRLREYDTFQHLHVLT